MTKPNFTTASNIRVIFLDFKYIDWLQSGIFCHLYPLRKVNICPFKFSNLLLRVSSQTSYSSGQNSCKTMLTIKLGIYCGRSIDTNLERAIEIASSAGRRLAWCLQGYYEFCARGEESKQPCDKAAVELAHSIRPCENIRHPMMLHKFALMYHCRLKQQA